MVESVSDYAIVLLDPDGWVRSWNAGATGSRATRPTKHRSPLLDLLPPKQAVADGLRCASCRSHAEAGSLPGRGLSEAQGWLAVLGERGDHGAARRGRQLVGFSKITRDLTERREHEELLRRSEERFRLLVEGVQDYAIFMLDPDGRIASWNSGAQQNKGYTADEIIGQHFSVFYPPEVAARGLAARGARAGAGAGTLRGRGLARTQGRHAVLGQRGDHGAA